MDMRSGIIGGGFIGGVHAYAVRAAGGVLAHIAGQSLEHATEAARRLGAEHACASAAELINADDVDVVHICTPNALHVPQAEAVIAAGKHVICEKPLATDPGDARRLVETATGAGLVAAVPFVYRFYPSVREARVRIDAGEAGPLWLLHGSYLQDWLAGSDATNWRVDPKQGGTSRAFGDIGVHWCDLMEFTTGHRITRLIARMATAYPDRITETAPSCCSTPTAARPDRSWSARFHRAARTGCGSPSTARRPPTRSTRNCRTPSGSAGNAPTRWYPAARTPSRSRRRPTPGCPPAIRRATRTLSPRS
jgi:predicted dehydrogenase